MIIKFKCIVSQIPWGQSDGFELLDSSKIFTYIYCIEHEQQLLRDLKKCIHI